MFRPIEHILHPDSRHGTMVRIDTATGATRPMRIEDLYGMVDSLECGPAVPPDLRDQFDKARNAFLYSWFAYDLATLAEQQTYAVVEMALRHRLETETQPTQKPRGMAQLLKKAIARGWLDRADFAVAEPHPPGPTGNVLDMLPLMRNELMHGSTHLMPYATPDLLRLGFEIISKLFPDKGSGAKDLERIS